MTACCNFHVMLNKISQGWISIWCIYEFDKMRSRFRYCHYYLCINYTSKKIYGVIICEVHISQQKNPSVISVQSQFISIEILKCYRCIPTYIQHTYITGDSGWAFIVIIFPFRYSALNLQKQSMTTLDIKSCKIKVFYIYNINLYIGCHQLIKLQ